MKKVEIKKGDSVDMWNGGVGEVIDLNFPLVTVLVNGMPPYESHWTSIKYVNDVFMLNKEVIFPSESTKHAHKASTEPLTEYQKTFLIDTFFKNENYAGWRNIATKLVENGRCLVAGTECIWKGGIGNFIKTEEAKNAVDCTEYYFDLEYFLTSSFFKEYKEQKYNKLVLEKQVLEKECRELEMLK